MSFSKFRTLMDIWDKNIIEENKAKIKQVLDSSNYIFFFKHNNNLYASPEEGRLTFARMKDDKEDEGWRKGASFGAMDLGKAISGEKLEKVFSYETLPDLSVIDRESIEKQLGEMAENYIESGNNLKKVLNAPPF